MRLTTRLTALVGIALLPALVIQAYNEAYLRRSRMEAVREQALSSARGVTADFDRFVEGLRQVLVAVAATPAIRDRDPARCTEYLRAVARSYPAYMLLAVNDAEGKTLCNTSVGLGIFQMLDASITARAFLRLRPPALEIMISNGFLSRSEVTTLRCPGE